MCCVERRSVPRISRRVEGGAWLTLSLLYTLDHVLPCSVGGRRHLKMCTQPDDAANCCHRRLSHLHGPFSRMEGMP